MAKNIVIGVEYRVNLIVISLMIRIQIGTFSFLSPLKKYNLEDRRFLTSNKAAVVTMQI